MSCRQTRNVSLTPELEGFINDSLASGDYASASEVVRAGLRSLRSEGRVGRPALADWPKAGGECGALIRSRDWSSTPLGPINRWSLELRATVANIVNSPVAKVLMWGPSHTMIYNDAYIAIVGSKHPEALGGAVDKVWPEIWDWNRTMLEAGFRGELSSFHDQAMTLARDDEETTFFFDLFYTPVYEADASIGGVMCTVVDNTQRLATERRLAESEANLRRVTDALPMLIAYVDRGHVYRFANRAYEAWLGVSPEDMVGRHVREIVGEAYYELRREWIDRALAGEATSSEADLPHRDGARHRSEIRYVPDIKADGSVPGVYILVVDLEERAHREAMLQASDRRFRTAMGAVHGVLWTNSADGRMLGEQPGWAALTGQSIEEYQGYGWAAAVHPDDRGPSVASWNEAVAAKSMYVFEHRVRRHDGAWRTFAIRGLPILDEANEITEWVGVHTDITHQRAAEDALRDHAANLTREVRHRERAEGQLRQLNETLEARVIAEIEERRQAEAKLLQAQKMETVGKLTGGVAHDFNNLLQVVSGNLQLLGKDIAGNERAERRVANAMSGVARGAKLASQLLAFGRRQALEPKVINPGRFVRDMDDMLRRAIGEAIEIETVFAGGLWNTFADPVQIENAVLNMAINARDAMDGRGKLTIELANAHLDDAYARTHDEVAAGQYVMLAVTDTGCGMPADVVDKVFEPFYSTKAEGKGSGLGLSMVYGFVKQSGGHVKIYSEVGHGTTIKIYLPRAMEAEDVEVVVDAGPITGGAETVLVVEDDAEVRETAVSMLTDLGYRVLKAVDAQSALIVIESGIPIDILFTDVVMPGALKSPELARKARERLPGIAVLFTSGYTENSIVHGGKLDVGVELLSKPYTREALARKFRHVLANQRHRGSVKPASAEAPKAAAPVSPAARQGTILLVEDDALIRMSSAEILQSAGYVVVEAGSAEEAHLALQTAPIDVLVTDLNLPGASGEHLAECAREMKPAVRIVYATGDATAVKLDGEIALLAKPYDATQLLDAVVTTEPDALLTQEDHDVGAKSTVND
ncbi:type II toxin-antitoxin system ParD family antitoxin [Chenggangzhangella methanolivorans]|uniref:histidine kinase n=1 Tax=Chenggangzhangella methanolivorans TaxID=1437009 RepID=A0A9E6R8Q6_9HYPH|nr:type II toxin-antitoxin system ParD family antitoxin [Chenggangzhangella methanolivorans]QZN98883.1 type II toxin-antitoxin system ParD family antitoxin [Chenggangzhangella methanolivorans]